MSTSSEPSQTDRIRALNDDLRKHISRGHCHAVMTTGIAALGAEAVARIVKTIEVFDDFCPRRRLRCTSGGSYGGPGVRWVTLFI